MSDVGALLRHARRCRLGSACAKRSAVHLVHCNKGGGHACRCLEEAAAIQALLAANLVGHPEQPGFDLTLLFVLRVGIVFVAADDLGWDRGVVRKQLPTA